MTESKYHYKYLKKNLFCALELFLPWDKTLNFHFSSPRCFHFNICICTIKIYDPLWNPSVHFFLCFTVIYFHPLSEYFSRFCNMFSIQNVICVIYKTFRARRWYFLRFWYLTISRLVIRSKLNLYSIQQTLNLKELWLKHLLWTL